MKHVDDETLAMLAVTDVVADDEVAAHLADCARCRAEVADLQRVAAVTRSAADVELTAPPERVWDRIAAEIAAEGRAGGSRDPGGAGASDGSGASGGSGGSGALADPSAATDETDRPGGVTAVPGSVADRTRPAPTRRARARTGPARGAPHTSGRRRGRRIAVIVAAGVGVLAVLLGIGVATDVLPGRPARSTETVVARADLAGLAGWSGAKGSAALERDRNGHLSLVVDVHGAQSRASAGALREVWMMRSDLKGLVSVGFLDGDRGRFTVPEDMDTARYPVIDVSAEQDDGNPAHSGDSIVRGALRTS